MPDSALGYDRLHMPAPEPDLSWFVYLYLGVIILLAMLGVYWTVVWHWRRWREESAARGRGFEVI